ncbi:MAG TPA: PqqD family protein [Longimicrobiales bacterium]|nr:PqqD family protein [Longimicrobiales bacterium]
MNAHDGWMPRLNDTLRIQRVAGESILLDTASERVHQLNEVGTFILDRCDGTRTVSRIVADIIEQYDVPDGTATRDATEMLDTLKTLGIVV